MKQLTNQQEVEIEIDLHGFERGTTPDKIALFLKEALIDSRRENVRYARVIVGRGINSSYAPSVVVETAQDTLRKLCNDRLIHSFNPERTVQGINEGALIVRIF